MGRNRDRKRMLPEKLCAACGRTFRWRRKWQRNWPQVKYCSRACRRGVPAPSTPESAGPQPVDFR